MKGLIGHFIIFIICNLEIFPYYFQCTEHESEDREDLIEAVNIMADVAAFINESKRRKDIVDKYKTEEEKTLTRKISKLNMHSIGKKSTRIGQRFLSSIGIESSVRDHQRTIQVLLQQRGGWAGLAKC